jgi:hypothetical protein
VQSPSFLKFDPSDRTKELHPPFWHILAFSELPFWDCVAAALPPTELWPSPAQAHSVPMMLSVSVTTNT